MAEILLTVLYIAPSALLFIGVVEFEWIYNCYIKERNYDNEITLFTDVINIYIGSDCGFY